MQAHDSGEGGKSTQKEDGDHGDLLSSPHVQFPNVIHRQQQNQACAGLVFQDMIQAFLDSLPSRTTSVARAVRKRVISSTQRWSCDGFQCEDIGKQETELMSTSLIQSYDHQPYALLKAQMQ